MRLVAAALFASSLLLVGAEIPRPAPELAISMPNGQQSLLSKYKGKVILVEFLLTTCPHCQDSAKLISKINTELGPKGFQPLGVAINPEGDVPEFIRQNGANFPVGKGTRDAALSFLQQSLMTQFYVPQMVFIDKKGVIRAQYGGTDPFVASNSEANIRGMVQKLLAESDGSAKPAPAKGSAAKAKKKVS
jgi:cytochrome oxidase Cu insertion factor (SCO1/SenC/PrrC family)